MALGRFISFAGAFPRAAGAWGCNRSGLAACHSLRPSLRSSGICAFSAQVGMAAAAIHAQAARLPWYPTQHIRHSALHWRKRRCQRHGCQRDSRAAAAPASLAACSRCCVTKSYWGYHCSPWHRRLEGFCWQHSRRAAARAPSHNCTLLYISSRQKMLPRVEFYLIKCVSTNVSKQLQRNAR